MSSERTRVVRIARPITVLTAALLVGGCPFFEDDPDSDADGASEVRGEDPDSDAGDGSDGSESDSDSSEESGDRATSCGLDVRPSPTDLSAQGCESGTVAVSETFSRTTGPPNVETRDFTVGAAKQLCLTVENGVGSKEGNGNDPPDGLSAAWIYVDGALVFGPDQFDPQTDELRETLDLSEGAHHVRVRLASKPGRSLRLEARVAESAPEREPEVGEHGRLKATNIAADHPLFSPNDDGYHDTTTFNVDNIATELLGRESGIFSYRIDWAWRLTNLDSCEAVEAGLTGTTPLNSPTNVEATWDGTDSSGSVVPDGNYAYEYEAELVRSDGVVVDRVEAAPRGVVVDTVIPDYSVESFGTSCDPEEDASNCRCPDETAEGTRCTFAWIPNLTTFESPSALDTSEFLTSRRDEATGRWEVVVDLRSFNGGGLVPQSSGRWESLDALQSYVSELTGVPADSNDTRLFNFDYTQLGYSTPVVRGEGVTDGFNHFLLDVITDASGSMTIDGRTIDLRAALRSSDGPVPERFRIDDRRLVDECGTNGNTDGVDDIRAKSCTELRTANLDPDRTNLGIYVVKKRIFGAEINGRGTVRDENCVVNGIYKCGVRTTHRDVDTTLSSTQYAEDDEIRAVRDVETKASGLPAVVSHTDRITFDSGEETSIIDGVCSGDSASSGPLTAPLDSGAGALPGTCVVNGIY